MAVVHYYTFLGNEGVWILKAIDQKFLTGLSLNVLFVLILLVFVGFCGYLLVFVGLVVLVGLTMLCI